MPIDHFKPPPPLFYQYIKPDFWVKSIPLPFFLFSFQFSANISFVTQKCLHHIDKNKTSTHLSMMRIRSRSLSLHCLSLKQIERGMIAICAPSSLLVPAHYKLISTLTLAKSLTDATCKINFAWYY